MNINIHVYETTAQTSRRNTASDAPVSRSQQKQSSHPSN